ncbi:Transmembrane protein-like protein [Aphelenchoides besseyi]|nr:Transmembrane protein-like protein [Aphelenchoides besseyi]
MHSEFAIGLVQCLISTILFGSAFVPIKDYDFGDGIYALQIRAIAIQLAGFIAAFLWTGLELYPLACFGGFIWTGACLCILPVIRSIGLGVTVLLYSFANCLTQWIIGNYGFFSLTMSHPPPAEKLWINYCGLVFLLIGGLMITFVKSEKKQPKISSVSTISTIPMFPEVNKKVPCNDYSSALKCAYYRVSACQLRQLNYQRIVAVIIAILSGCLFGMDIVPILVMQESGYFPDAPSDNKVFILSYYVGIGLTTSLVFIIYCIIKKNRPFVNPQLTIPSLISGTIWSFGQALFIICTRELSVAVSGPVSAIVPGCVASIWSVFYFKEISVGKTQLVDAD